MHIAPRYRLHARPSDGRSTHYTERSSVLFDPPPAPPCKGGEQVGACHAKTIPGLRLGGSSRHWWHAGAPGHRIEVDTVEPRLYCDLARTRVRAEVHKDSESEGSQTLRQIRGACRLCGSRERHRSFMGVDQGPDTGHMQTQLIGPP